MELGEKLRLTRLEAGLSQRALCGDEITRNMLSRIENGAARPSMKTLGCLAARLGKPVSYFLEEDTVCSPNQEIMTAVRQLFDGKDYAGATDMFQLEGTKEENKILEKYLPNYKINLVDAERLEDVEKFSDDLQVILTMLRYRDSKEELTDYINENKKFFQNVDYETSQAMKAFLNMKQIPGEAEHKEERIDMCKAIQEMYDDGVKDGIQKGKIELLKEQIQRKLKKEKTPAQIAEELEESVEVIEKIIKEM